MSSLVDVGGLVVSPLLGGSPLARLMGAVGDDAPFEAEGLADAMGMAVVFAQMQLREVHRLRERASSAPVIRG